jgi:hypothetical protein
VRLRAAAGLATEHLLGLGGAVGTVHLGAVVVVGDVLAAVRVLLVERGAELGLHLLAGTAGFAILLRHSRTSCVLWRRIRHGLNNFHPVSEP